MSLTAHERETVVNASDGDGTVRLWTSQRTVITAMSRRGVAPVRSGEHEGSIWAEFEIPADRFRIAMAVRKPRRVLTDDERARVRAQFQVVRCG